MQDCELFYAFFFDALLDMYDVSRRAHALKDLDANAESESGCPIFHLFPRFVRKLEGLFV